MKKQSSIDGFIPRQSSNQLGELHGGNKQKAYTGMLENRPIHTASGDTKKVLGQQKPGYGLGRIDIDESLREIDNTEKSTDKISRKQRRRLAKLHKKPRSKLSRIIKWLAIIVLLAGLAISGYMAYKFIVAGNNILQGNIFNVFKSQSLKQDSNGRSNFLILGTSEDDPGHDGANLTDSMLVVSVDQKNKNIYMFSVPRDLYVEYGTDCTAGSSGKINAYFSCVNSGTTAADEQDRLAKTQKLVGDIFGIDIQYGIHANGTVIKDAVNAVDGIDVDIEGSDGAPGILDRNFDWRCNYTCYYVKYDNGVHHLDGEHAWFLSMARGDTVPTYGLSNSNFDREKNQQKILMAIKTKAMTTGILTNLGAVTKLIDALGNNLRTNIQTNEIRTIMQLANSIKSSDMHTISLVSDDDPVVTSGDYDGASVVMPSAGIYDYNDIQTLIAKNLSSNPIVREAASIVVLNGTGQSGFGKTKADILTADGFNVSLIDNAPDGTYDAVEVYQIGTGNSATAKKLASIYNVTIKTTSPPIAVDSDVRFVIIFGAANS
jgi:LCP family protein required for cell wall assembly